MQAAEQALPPEPAGDEPQVTTCMLQLPDGSRRVRKVRPGTPLRELFTFVDACGAGGLPLGHFQLVTRFPRRVLDSSFEGSIADAQISPGQEAFMVQAKQ